MNKKIVPIIILLIILASIIPANAINNKNTLNKEINPLEKQTNKDLLLSNFPVMDIPISEIKPKVFSPKPAPINTPSEFNWMDYNGMDLTTPARNQGNCGSCWAFAALSVFESIIEIKEESPLLNPDLSEQYILSCLPGAGSCHGGSTDEAFELIISTTPEGNSCNGVILESCFGYKADDDIPCSEKCDDWEKQLVPLFKYNSWETDGSAQDIQRIKTEIMQKGPVAAHLRATDLFTKWGSINHNENSYFPNIQKVWGLNHVVAIVGWKDIDSIKGGGYWICKNSWGPDWGYNGFFNIEYGGLNIDKLWIISAEYDPDSYNWKPYADAAGPYGGFINQEVIFNAQKSFSVEGEIIDYQWDFGDGHEGSGVTTTHTYDELGKYKVTLTIEDSIGNIKTDETNIWIQETNTGPTIPTISGPTSGKLWKKYYYDFSSTDPDNNDLLYYIDWGDGKIADWIGPYESGESVKISHAWNDITSMITNIKVKSKDPFGVESEWRELPIKMPRYSFIDLPLVFNIFEKINKILNLIINS